VANQLMATAKKAFLDADIDMLVDNIKVVLVDTGQYTFNAAHQFLSDVAVGARVATSGNLANKSTTGGVFDADDITITSGASQPTVEAFYIYKDTGTASTSALIAWFDSAAGLVYTPPSGGGDVQLQFDNGANKIFKL
jgi:hypothetical protein